MFRKLCIFILKNICNFLKESESSKNYQPAHVVYGGTCERILFVRVDRMRYRRHRLFLQIHYLVRYVYRVAFLCKPASMELYQ